MAGFNGSGTFVRTYNWVTDKGNSVKVTASRMDGEDDGFATGLSSVICKDGQTTQTAVIPFAVGLSIADGADTAPAFKFISDTDTGIYRVGANTLGIVAAGAKVFEFGTATASTGGSLAIGGTITLAGLITGSSANFTATCAAAVVAAPSHTGASANFTATCAAAVVAAPSVTGASANFTATCAAAVLAAPSVTGASANFTATCEASLIKGASASFSATAQAATLVATTLIQNTGGQIAFPAVQVPSAGANTLDDYEEGTFTPALKFGGNSVGLTYTTQLGSYVKIGKLVFIRINIQVNSNGSSTGAATITGLPFTSENIASSTTLIPGIIEETTFGATGSTYSFMSLPGNSTTLDILLDLDGAFEGWSDTTITDGTVIKVSGHYIATA